MYKRWRGHRRRSYYKKGRRVSGGPVKGHTRWVKGKPKRRPTARVRRQAIQPRFSHPDSLLSATGHKLEAWASGHRARRHARRREVDEAVEFCAEILTDKEGWRSAVAGRAANFVSKQTWDRVTAGWHGYRCRALARLARKILTGKDRLHDAVGAATYRMWSLLGRPRIERVFAREVFERVPLPTDQPLITAARAVQATGIYVCVAEGRDLAYCQCFIDVVKAEGKKQIKALLLAAMDDWQDLGRLVPVPDREVDKPYGAPRDELIGTGGG